MLTEILLKLPVKSILRFKCLAKTWCHLLQNPTFVSQHFSISKNNKRLAIYCRNDENDINNMHLFVDNDQALVCYHDLVQELSSNFPDMHVNDFYVDNGLFCLYEVENSRIILWNPATREFRITPEYMQNILKKSYFRTPNLLGFGFDPLSNDYKVIYMKLYRDLDSEIKLCIAIYKMSTDSWRVFKEEEVQFFEDLMIHNNHNSTCVNGVYYWRVMTKTLRPGLYDHKILALHLGTEVFQVIQSPLSEKRGELLPSNDRISIWYGSDERNNYAVWVLNGEGHWTRILKIEPKLPEPYLVDQLFVFWKNNKLVLESKSRRLLVYDLDSKEFKELGDHTREAFECHFVYTYEESLVSINRE
ncbi:hypothetical protein PTKIN_Ptkin17bG0117800 [Pterospermum kingtungense]